MIETLAWVLPRPRKSKYKGGFPLHFEKKIIRLLGFNEVLDKERILHPFGGMAEFGLRCDIKTDIDIPPDFYCDAHSLPFKDNSFNLVILDPPYSDQENKDLYGGKIKLRWGKYSSEAVRVCTPSGFVVVYHKLCTPTPKGTRLVKRILLETRVWHALRCIHIYQKANLELD